MNAIYQQLKEKKFYGLQTADIVSYMDETWDLTVKKYGFEWVYWYAADPSVEESAKFINLLSIIFLQVYFTVHLLINSFYLVSG
jgi:hypothetical protein